MRQKIIAKENLLSHPTSTFLRSCSIESRDSCDLKIIFYYYSAKPRQFIRQKKISIQFEYLWRIIMMILKTPRKSFSDKKEYKAFKLGNGLKVLLVKQDARNELKRGQSSMAAVALCVASGCFQVFQHHLITSNGVFIKVSVAPITRFFFSKIECRTIFHRIRKTSKG